MKKTVSASQQEELQELQQQLTTQDMLISRLKIQNNALNEQIAALNNSISWKMTRPLRMTLHFIQSLQQNLIFAIQSGFMQQLRSQLRKLLFKIYHISWIKKRAIAFLERFPILQQRLIGMMHKKNIYLSNPYYNNDNITNSAYLPKTARRLYIELSSDKTVN